MRGLENVQSRAVVILAIVLKKCRAAVQALGRCEGTGGMKAGPVTWPAASLSLSRAWPGAPRSGVGLNSMRTDPPPPPPHLVLSTATPAETAPPMTPISGEFPGPSTLLMEGGVGWGLCAVGCPPEITDWGMCSAFF